MKVNVTTFLVSGAIALVGCAGEGIREVRSANGVSVYEAKCKSSASDCIAAARVQCPGGYEVLDSESHAGGVLADTLPGPVTWYVLTLVCKESGDAPMATFEHRGGTWTPPTFQPPPSRPIESEPKTVSPTVEAGCASDFQCGFGKVCVKPQFASLGTCATAVDSMGVPTYAPPRSNSIGPGGEGNCSFDTDCSVGFHCIKGSSFRGNCMK